MLWKKSRLSKKIITIRTVPRSFRACFGTSLRKRIRGQLFFPPLDAQAGVDISIAVWACIENFPRDVREVGFPVWPGWVSPAVAGRRTGRSGKENQIALAMDQPRLPSVEPQPAQIAAGLPQPGCHAGAFARPMEPGNPADAQRGDQAVRPEPLAPRRARLTGTGAVNSELSFAQDRRAWDHAETWKG